MSSSVLFAIITVVLLIILAALSFRSSKTKKYKVVSSQIDNKTGGLVEEELTRGWNEKFDDIKDMKCFKNNEGRKVLLGTHWIIRIEEIKVDKEK